MNCAAAGNTASRDSSESVSSRSAVVVKAVGSVLTYFVATATMGGVTACDNEVYDLDRPSPELPATCEGGRLLSDGSQIYWFENCERSGQRMFYVAERWYNLWGCELRNCSETRKRYAHVIPSSILQTTPCVAARDGTVYWTQGAAPLVYTSGTDDVAATGSVSAWRQHVGQAEPERLFEFPTNTLCSEAQLDDNELFIAYGENILALSTTLDPFPRIVAAGQVASVGAVQLLLADGYVYWSDSGVIGRTKKDGTQPVELLTNTSVSTPIAVDQGDLYWVDAITRFVWRCLPPGCTGTQVKLGPAPSYPVVSLRFDSDHLYWLDNGYLNRCAKSGCQGGSERISDRSLSEYVLKADGIYGLIGGTAEPEIVWIPK